MAKAKMLSFSLFVFHHMYYYSIYGVFIQQRGGGIAVNDTQGQKENEIGPGLVFWITYTYMTRIT